MGGGGWGGVPAQKLTPYFQRDFQSWELKSLTFRRTLHTSTTELHVHAFPRAMSCSFAPNGSQAESQPFESGVPVYSCHWQLGLPTLDKWGAVVIPWSRHRLPLPYASNPRSLMRAQSWRGRGGRLPWRCAAWSLWKGAALAPPRVWRSVAWRPAAPSARCSAEGGAA